MRLLWVDAGAACGIPGSSSASEGVGEEGPGMAEEGPGVAEEEAGVAIEGCGGADAGTGVDDTGLPAIHWTRRSGRACRICRRKSVVAFVGRKRRCMRESVAGIWPFPLIEV